MSYPALAPSAVEGDTLSAAVSIDCIAASYPDEAVMRNVARSLLKHHGPKMSNLVLIGSGEAEPVRFARQSRRWNGRWSGGHLDPRSLPVFLASLAGLLLLAFTRRRVGTGWRCTLGLVAGRSGGLDGRYGLAWHAAGPAVVEAPANSALPDQRASPTVTGAWALVVHEMSRERRAGAPALLRGASLRWCAVAGPPICP